MTIPAMVLMGAGAAFLLIAAIGIIRLRDPLQRMHSATKAGTLGAALMLIGTALSRTVDTSVELWTILFLLITLPIGAQLLGRASYVSGTKLEGIDSDPLAAQLDRADAGEDGLGETPSAAGPPTPPAR